MKTIILQEPGRFAESDTPPPAAPGPGQALLRIERIGICGTDYHAFRGRQPFFQYPRILGHELGVVVEQVGEGVSHLRAGDRCAVEPYLHCGSCIACRAGKTNCCQSLQCLGVHVDGGMRESIVLPAKYLHPSNRLSLEQLALVETLGIGAHAVNRGGVTQGDTVLVLGAGPIGLTVMQFATLAGAQIVVVDPLQNRLDFANRMFPLRAGLTPGEDLAGRLKDALQGDLPRDVFDATGNAASMMSAFSLVAHGGRLVFVGLVQADLTFFDPEFHRRELTLLATRNSTAAEFRRIIHLMEQGTIQTDAWITHRSGFGDFISHFHDWLHPDSGVIKAMVSMHG